MKHAEIWALPFCDKNAIVVREFESIKNDTEELALALLCLDGLQCFFTTKTSSRIHHICTFPNRTEQNQYQIWRMQTTRTKLENLLERISTVTERIQQNKSE